MSSNKNKCKLADAKRYSKGFAEAVYQLENMHHGVLLATGALLPSLVSEEMADVEMLIIRSERISEDWATTADGPYFAIDGCENDFLSSPYLVWGDGKLSIATATRDISDILYSGESGIVYVAWVTRKSVSLQEFSINKEFEDYWYCTSRALEAHRFVPDDKYIESIHARFPSLLSDDEHRFIGGHGEPTYIAFPCA